MGEQKRRHELGDAPIEPHDFSPGSAWQTEAELNGASCMADAGGNLVPYASLMKRAAMHLSAIRAENAQLREALESIAAVAEGLLTKVFLEGPRQ
jgi:hypothetical protein